MRKPFDLSSFKHPPQKEKVLKSTENYKRNKKVTLFYKNSFLKGFFLEAVLNVTKNFVFFSFLTVIRPQKNIRTFFCILIIFL